MRKLQSNIWVAESKSNRICTTPAAYSNQRESRTKQTQNAHGGIGILSGHRIWSLLDLLPFGVIRITNFRVWERTIESRSVISVQWKAFLESIHCQLVVEIAGF